MTECPRCGIPSPHDDAAGKHGGMTSPDDIPGDLCMACIDKLQETAQDAQLRLDDPTWDPEQAALDDW